MDVIIVGAGGHGRVVLDILRAAGDHKVIGFLDADEGLHGTTVAGIKVLGHLNVLPKLKAKGLKGAFVGIGDNRVRQTYADKLAAAGLELINAVHPSAVVSPGATVGRNVMIAAGAIVCTEATLADSVIVNTAATVDHECQIGPAVHLGPGVRLAGRVTVHARALVGIGACVLPCLTVGEEATVGGAALIRQDVPPRATVVGVPARVIETRDPRTKI
ncbi:MAG TPA: acetyltransferase [Tepidisphaeraceae bacterium]|nr:acetyltransferase [Tepidisphaeraceae bacterium]